MDTFNRITLSAEGADDSAQSFDSFVNSHGTGIKAQSGIQHSQRGVERRLVRENISGIFSKQFTT